MNNLLISIENPREHISIDEIYNGSNFEISYQLCLPRKYILNTYIYIYKNVLLKCKSGEYTIQLL